MRKSHSIIKILFFLVLPVIAYGQTISFSGSNLRVSNVFLSSGSYNTTSNNTSVFDPSTIPGFYGGWITNNTSMTTIPSGNTTRCAGLSEMTGNVSLRLIPGSTSPATRAPIILTDSPSGIPYIKFNPDEYAGQTIRAQGLAMNPGWGVILFGRIDNVTSDVYIAQAGAPSNGSGIYYLKNISGNISLVAASISQAGVNTNITGGQWSVYSGCLRTGAGNTWTKVNNFNKTSDALNIGVQNVSTSINIAGNIGGGNAAYFSVQEIYYYSNVTDSEFMTPYFQQIINRANTLYNYSL
jgi:hypothetical protein